MTRVKMVAAVMLAATGLWACSSSQEETTGNGQSKTKLSGSISVDGSSTVYPVTQAIAEKFGEKSPDVKISVGVSGTGGGFEKFCRGEIDIADASRPIEDEEIAACKQNNIEYTQLQVAIDGLSVVVNPKTTFVECLTTAELKALWEPSSKVNTWNAIRPSFPKKPISLYGPGTDSGTFDYFTKEIVGEEGKSRADYTASEDDNVLVKGVSGDENALAYFGYAYYQENSSSLKVLAINSGKGCVKPTTQTINSGEYAPLSRPIFIYVAKKSAAKRQIVEFVDFYLANAAKVAPEVGYVSMPGSVETSETAKWKSFKAAP